MSHSILVPLDGSPVAERALPYAERLAGADTSRIVLLQAAEACRIAREDPVIATSRAIGAAQTYLHHVARRLSAAGHRIETVACRGHPAHAILAPARGVASTLRADVTLLRVIEPPPAALYPTPGTWVGLDPEPEQLRARAYLQHVADWLRPSAHSVRVRVELGLTPTRIAEVVQRESADMLAMAIRGPGGRARLVHRSTVSGMLQRSRVPLLLVGPGHGTASADCGGRAPAGAPDAAWD